MIAWEIIVALIAGLFGGGGLAALLRTRADTFATDASATKALAEADSLVVTAAETAVRLVTDRMQEQLDRVKEQVTKLDACVERLAAIETEVAALRSFIAEGTLQRRVEQLEEALRKSGSEIPAPRTEEVTP